MSAVSKTVLQSVRNFKDIKDLKNIDGCSYSITEGQPCEAYEIIAKYATRKSISGQLDGSIYGNIGGVTAATFSNMMKNKKIINDFTQGNITTQLIQFTMPLLLSNLLQTVYNMVDMMIVGQVMAST